MKKFFYSIALLISVIFSANSQVCTLTSLPGYGFYSQSNNDSIICADKGQPVNDVVHMMFPSDLGAFTIQYVQIDSIRNLPPGITATINKGWGGQYTPDEIGCITFSGTAPNANYFNRVYIYVGLKITVLPTLLKGELDNILQSQNLNDSMPSKLYVQVKNTSTICAAPARIKGNVYIDANYNCTKDSIDHPLGSHLIMLNDTQVNFTDIHGNYTLYPDSFGTHTIEIDTTAFKLTCGNSRLQVTVTPQNPQSIDNNFAFEADTTFRDLSVTFNPFGWWLFGYTGSGYISYHNNAYVPVDATIRMSYDTVADFHSSDILPSLVDTVNRVIEWQLPNVPPRSQNRILLSFQLPLPVDSLTPVHDTLWIFPTAGDANPLDNEFYTNNLITGSYDPNDKQVSPYGINRDGKIDLSDSVLTYKVRFQNTGTGPAVNVVIVDTLDSDLNLSSFRPLMSSHPYSTDLKGNIVTFTFSNIMLPDSNSNEPESHGFVEYRIKKKTGLGYGTVIENSASIYFDFNDPVKTNTVVSRYELPLSVRETHIAQTVELYPNPTNDVLHIAAGANIEQVYISDISGRVVLQQNVADISTTLNVQELPVGMYFVSVKVSGSMVNKRFIKQ